MHLPIPMEICSRTLWIITKVTLYFIDFHKDWFKLDRIDGLVRTLHPIIHMLTNSLWLRALNTLQSARYDTTNNLFVHVVQKGHKLLVADGSGHDMMR